MKRKHLGFVAVPAVALIALCAAVTPAIGEPQHPSRIVGRVVDADNNRVAGAQVALMVGPGEILKRTVSNDNGEFEFRPIRAGQYAVGAAKPEVGHGHTPRFAVRPGETQRVPVRIGD